MWKWFLLIVVLSAAVYAMIIDHELLRVAFSTILLASIVVLVSLRTMNLVDAIGSAVVTCDAEGLIRNANQAALQLFDKDKASIRNCKLLSLMTPRANIDRCSSTTTYRSIDHGIFEIHTTEKSSIWVRLRVIPSTGERTMFILDDVTDNIHLSEQMADLAELDHMTGLKNRSFLIDQLAAIRSNKLEDRAQQLALIDLDHFRAINDAGGPHVGDLLIMQVVMVLRQNQRRGNVIARLGSDVFAVLFYDTTPEDTQRICDNLRHAIAAVRVTTEKHIYTTTASIGLCGIEQTQDDPVLLLTLAEVAMNIAKSKGRDRVHRFEGEDHTQIASTANDLDWKQRLDQAMASNSLSLALDPIVNSTTGVVLCYEALLRFHERDGCITRPSHFLPSAERFGLMREIDRWVIARAMVMLVKRREYEPGARFSINLSGITLEDPDICRFIEQRLIDNKLPGKALIFEITETIAITRMQAAVALLTRLKQIGCETALDDFGAGMSSFAYLRNLPVDYLKIDGQFIREIDRDTTDLAMVRAMVELARAHDIQVIAEYVENKPIQGILLSLGVNYLQGEFVTTGVVKTISRKLAAARN